ncbi:MAG TPA: DUF2624 family protein [Bacillota bacterium]|nr:DUF2624 family protein [Bacillota bacterium]
MSFLKEIMMNKLKHISPEQLMDYGKQYGFSITSGEARHIVNYIHQEAFNPFDVKQHEKIFQDLANMTNPHTAKKGQQLFIHLVKSYGLEHLFH